MTPEEIRDFIIAGFNAGQSLKTIRDNLAARAGLNPIQASTALEAVLPNAFPGQTFNFAGLQPEGTPTPTGAAAAADPGGLGIDPMTGRPIAALPTVPVTGFGGAGATGAGALGGPPAETLAQAFDRFLSLTPAGRSPALRQAAQAREGLLESQFMLQQPQQPGGDPSVSAFRNFLQTGNPLTGEALGSRLAQLAAAVLPEELPFGSSRAALRGAFEDPLDAFRAFALPQLQSVAPAFRPALERTLQQQFNQFLGRTPGAGAADVARFAGYNMPGA